MVRCIHNKEKGETNMGIILWIVLFVVGYLVAEFVIGLFDGCGCGIWGYVIVIIIALAMIFWVVL